MESIVIVMRRCIMAASPVALFTIHIWWENVSASTKVQFSDAVDGRLQLIIVTYAKWMLLYSWCSNRKVCFIHGYWKFHDPDICEELMHLVQSIYIWPAKLAIYTLLSQTVFYRISGTAWPNETNVNVNQRQLSIYTAAPIVAGRIWGAGV